MKLYEYLFIDKGRPLATYKWFKEGNSKALSTGETWRLNATSSEDSGKYYCEASNSVANVNSEPVQVNFYSKSSLTGSYCLLVEYL